ncbi:hypothetical protein [Chitinasiproducens palmae]|uniref:Uncharacterized protein n=1 Tax=Chitinasiproducens palmae TaxID=1770053 RepID=A0A1H2PJ11_9BURK|nr:hypothetical protein [Chitinasiproducens palmae]SDV46257.1 hypothetical protein SAMN05216551_101207 [Chitinasiproducens palmae]
MRIVGLPPMHAPASAPATPTWADASPVNAGSEHVVERPALSEEERRAWILAQFREEMMRRIFFPDPDAPDALPRLRPDGGD